jgi:hypothetical protein
LQALAASLAAEAEVFPPRSSFQWRCRVSAETLQAEYPYVLKIETSTGRFTDLPIAFLTAKQIESFLQSDFQRLVREAGIKGVRIHVERAVSADYEKILGDVAAYVRTAGREAA